MISIYENNIRVLTMGLILAANLKSLNFTNAELNINDICQASNERYPDKDHNISDILHTYEICLQKLNLYSGTTRENLLKQLINKLDCFKEDLKQSYYAGNTKYNEVELVENLETEMQSTSINFGFSNIDSFKNNCNFARTARSTVKHIIPLVLTGTLSEKQKACDAIFKRDKGENRTQSEIPTPKLDDNKEPKELTVPLTCPTTYKVDSPEAENVLTQFYKVVMKCLTLTTEHKIQVFKFNKKFYDWLTQAVLPHLKDDKCYPAFGGVLRIVETMRQNDFIPGNATANFIFYRQKDLGKNEEELRKKNEYTGKIFYTPFFLIILCSLLAFILIIILFLAWTTGCLACGCCEKRYDSEDSSTEIFYYPIEETPSVSLDMDDVSFDHLSSSSDFNQNHRQRGGNNSQVYSLTYEQEDTLVGLPLKRQWPSKSSSSSRIKPTSPEKRPKTMWPN